MKKILSHLNKAKWWILVWAIWGGLSFFTIPILAEMTYRLYGTAEWPVVIIRVFFPGNWGFGYIYGLLAEVYKLENEAIFLGVAFSIFLGAIEGYGFYLLFSLLKKVGKRLVNRP